MAYREYEPSAPYLHLLSLPSWRTLRGPFVDELAAVDSTAGTVVEVGPGTGIGTELLLETVPAAPVLAAEPSAALRAVLLGRLADHRQAGRLTVLPCAAQELPLPERICAVLGAHMVGHLEPEARRALWGELARRLTPGAPVLLTVEPPVAPVAIPEFPPLEVRAAGLTYTGTGSCEPAGPETVRWRMRYTTRDDGGAVLHTAEAEYRYHTVSPDRLADELVDAGLSITTRADDRVVARAAGPVPPRTGAGRLRARTMLADPGRVDDWRYLLAREAAAEHGLYAGLPGTAAEVAERAGLDPRRPVRCSGC